MINVAVVGTGSIGRHHARIYSGIEDVHLVAIVDTQYNCEAITNYKDIIHSVDAVSIAVPTTLHLQMAWISSKTTKTC